MELPSAEDVQHERDVGRHCRRGGGLHGMSAALHIARRGKRVLVLEKDRIAAHASSYSAGGVRARWAAIRIDRDVASDRRPRR